MLHSHSHNTLRFSKSQLKTIRDTSGFAANAVQGWINEDSGITAFRYRVRLGVGKHFTQFVWFLLPFYVALKFWWCVLSVLIGLVFGHVFLYVVFKCRKRYSHNRGRVVMGASAFVAICSSICFMLGVWIVDDVWGITIGSKNVILPVAFFCCLAICGLFQGVKYYEHRKHSTEEVEDLLFDETAHEKPQDAGADTEEPESTTAVGDEAVEVMPNETNNSTDRREVMHKDSMNATGHGYFYHTGKKVVINCCLCLFLCLAHNLSHNTIQLTLTG